MAVSFFFLVEEARVPGRTFGRKTDNNPVNLFTSNYLILNTNHFEMCLKQSNHENIVCINYTYELS